MPSFKSFINNEIPEFLANLLPNLENIIAFIHIYLLDC